jgi:hypothetical protein
MSRFGDLLREGASDILGWGEEREQLTEAALEGRMLSRALETVGWTGLDGTGIVDNYFEPTREAREQEVERAYRYFFEDPIIKQGVKVKARYVYGKGMATPRFRHEKQLTRDGESTGGLPAGASEPLNPAENGASGSPADYQQATDGPPEGTPADSKADDLIKRFWLDPENQVCLTGHTAQREKEEELTLQGNIFFLLYRQEGEAPETRIGAHGRDVYDPPTLKLTDLRTREVVEIITHPGNRKIPVYYKRTFRERVFAFEGVAGDLTYGVYQQASTQPRVRYYRDWRFKAPTEWPEGSGNHWGPKPEQIVEDCVMYHIAVNKTSDMRFGLTEVKAALKWAQGLGQYMTNRMQVAQAIASIAMQAKVKGGPQAVNQVKGALTDISRLANQVAGSETLNLGRADQGRTKIAVGNDNAKLEPMVQDSGAAGAQIDTTIFKGQIAAALGVPVTHLGESGGTNLATATSMDAPLLRMCEDRQELWEEAIKDIIGYMLEGADIDPHRVEVQMPPILQRDVNSITTMLLAVLAALDPNGSNRELMRFVFGEILDAMGKTNTREILDEVLPPHFKTPHEQNEDQAHQQAVTQAHLQAAGGGGAEGGPAPPAMHTAIQKAAAMAKKGAQSAELAANQGRRRGGDRAGGPGGAGGESRDRAQNRRERALSPREAGFISTVFEEIEDENLREAAYAAMAGLDPLVPDDDPDADELFEGELLDPELVGAES